MIRFTTVEGKNVAVDPQHIASAESTTRAPEVKSLLSGALPGSPCVRITLVTGLSFIVDDPNGTVISQIEAAKKGES